MQIQVTTAEDDFLGQKKEDILIAKDNNGNHLGTITLHPYFSPDLEPAHPHNIAILFHPAENIKLINPVKDELLLRALQRSREIKQETGSHKTRLYACYFKHQQDDIDYFLKKGFKQDESMLILEKKVSNSLQEIPLPEGVYLTDQFLDTVSGQNQLLDSHQEVFPRHAYTSKQLHGLLTCPSWKNMTAMSGKELVGNIMLYADNSDQTLGYIEDLFIKKEWRKKGIGKSLVIFGLNYFISLGVSRVRLELWSANKAAFNLYKTYNFTSIEETEIAVGLYI